MQTHEWLAVIFVTVFCTFALVVVLVFVGIFYFWLCGDLIERRRQALSIKEKDPFE